MKYLALLLLLSIVGAHSMSSADGLTSAESLACKGSQIFVCPLRGLV
jgi:hypothetical protein